MAVVLPAALVQGFQQLRGQRRGAYLFPLLKHHGGGVGAKIHSDGRGGLALQLHYGVVVGQSAQTQLAARQRHV